MHVTCGSLKCLESRHFGFKDRSKMSRVVRYHVNKSSSSCSQTDQSKADGRLRQPRRYSCAAKADRATQRSNLIWLRLINLVHINSFVMVTNSNKQSRYWMQKGEINACTLARERMNDDLLIVSEKLE